MSRTSNLNCDSDSGRPQPVLVAGRQRIRPESQNLNYSQKKTILVRSFSAGQAPDKIGSLRLPGFADSLKWERGPEGLKVELPEKKPGEYAYVLKISRDKSPE